MEQEEYKVIESHKEHIGRFDVICDKVEKNGAVYPYSYVIIKNCVSVLCFYHGKVLLLHQYRHTLKTWELEIPAGSVEPGEDPVHAAEREVQEETGSTPTVFHFLGKYHLSAGSTTEQVWIYWTELEDGEIQQDLEALELIDLLLITPEEFDRLIATNEFHQCMGATAWYLYNNRERLSQEIAKE